ncbi:MAG: hypothetical protein Unbinned1446contig1005_23 [Prokaryotic dsDNA virus sp.]|mgnify:CR=1 FL=1|nr:MAG: hypothetical protein Unbinned1446contig1005_23 [Prokaryotic dsDNA virus sp.]|tara:strand:+ start:1204 stop:1815 length:612 start_codon:yes stop_codon:yes gene_type:complete
MNVKITIPDSYADITVQQFKRLQAGMDAAKNETEKMYAVLFVLAGLTREQVGVMEKSSYDKVMKCLAWVMETPDKNEHALIDRFTLDGVEYGFIPNFTKLTVGEFVDLEHWTTEGVFDNLEKMLAILYRPVIASSKHLYDIEPYEAKAGQDKIMLNCRMDVAVGAMVFFYNIGLILARDTQQSLQAAATVNLPLYQANGAGMK